MDIVELPDGVVVRRVTTPEDVVQWRGGFVGAYQTIFSGHPYYERFYPSEAEGIWHKLTSTSHNVSLVATRGIDEVVGFGIAIPLSAKEPVAKELTGLIPIAHTFYLAELGVMEKARGKNIGRTLVRERLGLIDKQRFSHVVLRVSTHHTGTIAMYRSMGFEEMGVYMDVASMRVDGRVTTDRRQFFSAVVSQVHLR
jgi:ribosomal protein S18 acetylase RimI-like enzyme